MAKITKTEIKKFFFVEGDDDDSYFTGLEMELEDGRIVREYSTDILKPYGVVKED